MIDVCVNLLNSQFRNDRQAVVQRAGAAGIVGLLITATNLSTSRQAIQLCETGLPFAEPEPEHLPSCYCTAGVHPHDAAGLPADWQAQLQQLAANDNVRAIGETGLDFYRNFAPQAQQIEVFRVQIALALTLQKPLFVHDRESQGEVLRQLREQRQALPPDQQQDQRQPLQQPPQQPPQQGQTALPPVLIHCFTGTEAELHAYLQAGFYIGITGWVSDPRRGQSLRQLVKQIPLHRLVVETDAPFLRPNDVPADFQHRHKLPNKVKRRNEPALLPWIIKAIAQARDEPAAEIVAATTANAQALFGFDNPKATPNRVTD